MQIVEFEVHIKCKFIDKFTTLSYKYLYLQIFLHFIFIVLLSFLTILFGKKLCEVNIAEVIASREGGKLLVYKGYSYQFHKNGAAKKIWICKETRHRQCRGRLHSSEYIPDDCQLVKVLHEETNHNHTPDPASIEKAKVVNKVKEAAATSTDSTASVVASAIQGSSVACLGMIPSLIA